jgi:YjbE family integral membrane protein
MLAEIFSASALTALFQVIMIDLVLAGDNAIVIALAAAGLPKEQRAKVIALGIAAATILRIVLALITTQLLGIVGLLLAGGILLLWVSWKMWRELKSANDAKSAHGDLSSGESGAVSGAPRKTLKQAVWQIIIADFSMSLDNVLAVGGAAREHPWVLIFGLALSIALMAVAASWIARVLQKHYWVGYVGLAIIVYVAIEMIWRGWHQVAPFASSFASSNPVIVALAVVAAIGALSLSALRMKRSKKAGD